ncbi:dTDP-glucose 4,6-dehydratase [Lentibacillus sp. CBA3610]|uniref:dTDP-glucose 4,6-dehydratase n=1 Tax=Lentibacillus sp. CBA3610 TaxID=2518176 RepID=UPI0015950587|nr:NAD-dependent epimerase/dehydratase family protein [Lentibacillus sp. CBA3610]QKY71105.1 NAD-dependent epimerase/dehydratase family protein [Lentibacillus sp. CBA3610]
MRQSIVNSNVLVIGGAGFIGSHLADRLIAEGANQVVIIDSLFIGKKANIKKALNNGAILYVDDAENQEALGYIIENHAIDIVFNCATKPLNYSFINPSNTFLTNVLVLKNLLECQRQKKFQTLCHVSSSEAYGSAQYEPMDEGHPLDPETPYAAGKAAADLMLQTYVNMFDLDAFIIRPFNNYGPRQNFAGPMAGVIPLTINKILENEQPEIHGDGKQTRDYVYVEDTAEMALNVFPFVSPGESVNISTDQQLSIQYVIESIENVMNYQGETLKKPVRTADVMSHRGTVKKLHTLIGQWDKTPFKEGIQNTVNWVKAVKEEEGV